MREVWEMVASGKPRLIGPMVISKVVHGRGFFIGPVMYYLLAPLAIIFKWNVILITKALLFMWWLTALGILIWISKRFSWLAGLAAYGIFASLPFLIDFSHKIWNPNFLPLIGIGFFWLLEEIWRKEKKWHWFLLGFFLGLGINFHYSAFLWLLFFLSILALGWRRKKFKFFHLGLPLFVLGIIIGDLPLFLFELRHNFYNLQTVFFIAQHGIFEGKEEFALGRHNLLALIPVFFWGLAYLIHQFEKKFGFQKTLILILIVFLFLVSNIDWQKEWSPTMPKGWNVTKQQKVAQMICQDVKKEKTDCKFEVAATIHGDTRATALRWWLSREGCTPMRVEDYPQAKTLYLIAPESRPPEEETVWEVSVIKPFEVVKERSLKDGIIFYKLEKTEESK